MATDDKGPQQSPDNRALLLQLHLNEYQALATRCTYFITMQYALWPTLFVSLSLLAPLWATYDHTFLLWAALFLAQVVSMGWYFAGCEVYITIEYLECVLKPRIREIMPAESFWGWEPWLAERRGDGPQWWEWWVTCSVATLFCVLLFSRPPWCYGYWIGFLLNTTCWILILAQNVRLVKIRQRFSNLRSA